MEDLREKYLDLLKKSLTHSLWPETYKEINFSNKYIKLLFSPFIYILRKREIILCRKLYISKTEFEEGRGWPPKAETMIGYKRLNNLQECIKDVLFNDIPGDFIEAGVWRGGATIFMKGVLESFGNNDRIVWVADSFEGLPKPNIKKYPYDKGDQHFKWKELSVGLDKVNNNFKKYNLLDENVRFIKGWFKESLPNAPIKNLAILRIDGDMYESTMDALIHLYPKLSVGGYIIIDDMINESCSKAVKDFRREYNISENIIEIDWTGVYWKKASP